MYQHAEVVHWMKNKSSKKIIPAHAEIYLTNLCNQDCFYCNSADFRKENKGVITFKDAENLINKLSTWRAHSPDSYGTLHSISFVGGGEPTLFKGYEKLIEQSIDCGFLVNLITNGSKLEKMLDLVPIEKLQKLSFIGVDVDAGTKKLYEQIRRSIPSKSLFDVVVKNARRAVSAGINVDIKMLITDLNDTSSAVEDMILLTKEIGARMLYIRPVILNGKIYPITEELQQIISELSAKHSVKTRINLSRFIPRTYNRCHQMFQFITFAPDGKIYTCCDNSGNSRFELCSWVEGDFRNVWLGDRHQEIYNSINTAFCQPCRPNKSNNTIQSMLNDPSLLETLKL